MYTQSRRAWVLGPVFEAVPDPQDYDLLAVYAVAQDITALAEGNEKFVKVRQFWHGPFDQRRLSDDAVR